MEKSLNKGSKSWYVSEYTLTRWVSRKCPRWFVWITGSAKIIAIYWHHFPYIFCCYHTILQYSARARNLESLMEGTNWFLYQFVEISNRAILVWLSLSTKAGLILSPFKISCSWPPSLSWKAETTFHYCWEVKSRYQLVWIESTSPHATNWLATLWSCATMLIGMTHIFIDKKNPLTLLRRDQSSFRLLPLVKH